MVEQVIKIVLLILFFPISFYLIRQRVNKLNLKDNEIENLKKKIENLESQLKK